MLYEHNIHLHPIQDRYKMIREIRIKNYKSIQKLKMDMGQFTVLIGENGSGKSNILEALALASAAANDKLDNEFLASRGIRVTDSRFMRSAFESENISEEIFIHLSGDGETSFKCKLQNDNEPYSKWRIAEDEEAKDIFGKALADNPPLLQNILESIAKRTSYDIETHLDKYELDDSSKTKIIKLFDNLIEKNSISDKPAVKKYLIYSPENFALRTFEKEGQIEPLGIQGEGLFKLLKVLSTEKNIEKYRLIKEKLKAINWFEDFEIPDQLSETEKLIRIKDKYLREGFTYFDQRSSNEGFLFLLFYFALFVSDNTPDFFAIDNIDASLNPKLCCHLTKELVHLGKKFSKQAIVTTHNPAILDGLNLDDPEQKLFVVFRNKLGYTKVRQIFKPETPQGQEPVKLSEAFLRGYIGGLPKGF